MSSIKHFRTELKIKIETLESEFDSLAERMACSEQGSEEVVRNYAESLFRRIERKRLVPNTGESELDQHRGDFRSPWVVSARRRALAAMEVAGVALDEAAQAAMEAWLAEKGEAAQNPDEPVCPKVACHER